MDGWMDGWMEYVWMDGWMYVDGCMRACTWMDGWMYVVHVDGRGVHACGWMDACGWMYESYLDGCMCMWMDGCVHACGWMDFILILGGRKRQLHRFDGAGSRLRSRLFYHRLGLRHCQIQNRPIMHVVVRDTQPIFQFLSISKKQMHLAFKDVFL
jgi:hypothetical protein